MTLGGQHIPGQSDPSNIKSRAHQNYNEHGVRPYMKAMKSPIPATIKDAREFARFFKSAKDVFIPYAGTNEYSSHGLLGLLLAMRELSQTTSGVLLAKKRFALAGKIEIVQQEDEVFDIGEVQPATDSEKIQFRDFAENVVWRDLSGKPVSPRQMGKWISDDIESTGNAYLEVILTETQGVKSVHVDILRPEDCLYMVTNPGEEQRIAVSPIWNVEYINRNPPRVLPVYPAMGEVEEAIRTIIHVKEGNYAYYGRPQSISGLNYQYFEWQNSDYLNKTAYSQFAGQVFIEVEDPEPIAGQDLEAEDQGFENFARKAENNLTNKADDLQTLLISSRPYGASPAFIFQFQPNTNENWYTVTNEQAERQICKAHGFPRRLVGLEETTGLSSNVFVDVLRTFSPTLFRELQQRVEAPINLAYRLAAEWLGDNITEGLAVRFTSPYANMIEEAQEQNQNQNGDTDTNS